MIKKILKPSLKNKIKGAIFSHACGDYLGMPVEFATNPERVKSFFGEKGIRPIETNARGIKPPGYYTDDTAMMLCLTQSLLEKGFDIKDQFEKYKRWAFEGYMSPDLTASGIGQNTVKKLMRQKAEDIPEKLIHNEKEGGNGALMRCLPIGLFFYKNIDEIVEKSFKSALVTHNNEIAVWTSIVFNVLIAYILQGLEKKELFEKIKNETFFSKIPQKIQNTIDNLENKNETELQTSGYSLNTLEIALYCFLNTDTLEEAIKRAIYLGGDTDTQAAVTGGLAGAYYGYEEIPKNWVESLQNKKLIEDIANNLYLALT